MLEGCFITLYVGESKNPRNTLRSIVIILLLSFINVI